MKPFYADEFIAIYNGDCREVMRSLSDCSVESIVTDPPYELGFMDKGWDRSGIAYDVAVWSECLRVLKPGGHLLAFGGSRTYHRLACAIENAGFEIRDQIQWIYGSGFPKSLDVSKSIDQAGGLSPQEQSTLLRDKRTAAGLSRDEIAAAVGCTPSSVRDWEEGRARAVGRAIEYIIPSPEYRAKLADVLGYTSDERVIIGAGNGSRSLYETGHRGIAYGGPQSESAKQWDGWGTALKPAHEPIVLARKPLIGTVAENVLRHGTGGLNIDGCRIEGRSWGSRPAIKLTSKGKSGGGFGQTSWEPIAGQVNEDCGLGRWPANVIHDGSDEVLALFPDTESGNGNRRPNGGGDFFKGINAQIAKFDGDSGNAARFFYCAKASQEDRNEGLEDLPMQSAGAVTDRKDGSAGLNSPRAGAGRNNGSRNPHPTVKPTDLMRYLCRLVTPPGGTVLDPFCGSGSTGKAAVLEGLRFIGVELSAEYCELARRRIKVQYNRMTLYHLIEAKEQQGALLDG